MQKIPFAIIDFSHIITRATSSQRWRTLSPAHSKMWDSLISGGKPCTKLPYVLNNFPSTASLTDLFQLQNYPLTEKRQKRLHGHVVVGMQIVSSYSFLPVNMCLVIFVFHGFDAASVLLMECFTGCLRNYWTKINWEFLCLPCIIVSKIAVFSLLRSLTFSTGGDLHFQLIV